MRLKNAIVVLVAGIATLTGSSAEAHIPFVEPEAREDAPASLSESDRATKDYSFENHFPLPDDLAFQAMHDFQYDGVDSMAVKLVRARRGYATGKSMKTSRSQVR